MRRTLIPVLIAALGGMAAGCSDRPTIFSPEGVIAGAVSFTAPDVYAQWWRDTEACSGRTGDYTRVQWYVVPHSSWFEFRGGQYNGYWWETHDIVLAEHWIDQPGVVRHEMLHDLLNTGEHPAEYFQNRCAAVVQ